MNLNKDELIKKYKTNSLVRYGVIAVLLIIAYNGGFFSLFCAAAGLGLGYLAYNDVVDKDI